LQHGPIVAKAPGLSVAEKFFSSHLRAATMRGWSSLKPQRSSARKPSAVIVP